MIISLLILKHSLYINGQKQLGLDHDSLWSEVYVADLLALAKGGLTCECSSILLLQALFGSVGCVCTGRLKA